MIAKIERHLYCPICSAKVVLKEIPKKSAPGTFGQLTCPTCSKKLILKRRSAINSFTLLALSTLSSFSWLFERMIPNLFPIILIIWLGYSLYIIFKWFCPSYRLLPYLGPQETYAKIKEKAKNSSIYTREVRFRRKDRDA